MCKILNVCLVLILRGNLKLESFQELHPGNYLKDVMRLNTLETQLSGKKPSKDDEPMPSQVDLPIPTPPAAATATVTTTTGRL